MSHSPTLVAQAPVLTSASGILALLEEDSDELKTHALGNLHAVVDEFWAEIADARSLARIESLSEDEAFASRELAASIASLMTELLASLVSLLVAAAC